MAIVLLIILVICGLYFNPQIFFNTALDTLIRVNDNPRIAQVQDEDFNQYESSFKIIEEKISEYKNELKGYSILLKNSNKIGIYKYDTFIIDTFDFDDENAKMLKILRKDTSFVDSTLSIGDIMGRRYDSNGDEYENLKSIREIRIYDDRILFIGDIENARAINYIAYTFNEKKPLRGLQQNNNLKIKEFEPGWYSVVEGEIEEAYWPL